MAEENKEKDKDKDKDQVEASEVQEETASEETTKVKAEEKAEPKEEKKEEKAAEPEEEIEIDERFTGIVEQIEKMSVVDLADLVHVLEKKFGVSAAAPAAAAGAAGGGEEKSELDIVLQSAGDQKINVIKVVKEITGLGLKEAKDLVDGAPGTVKESVKREEAEEMKKKLEEAGATVDLK